VSVKILCSQGEQARSLSVECTYETNRTRNAAVMLCPHNLYRASHAIQTRDDLKPLLHSISLLSTDFQKIFLNILNEAPEFEPCRLLRATLDTYVSSTQYQNQRPSIESVQRVSPELAEQLLSKRVEVPLSDALREGIRERKFILYQLSIPSNVGRRYVGLTDLSIEAAVQHQVALATKDSHDSLYEELNRYSFLYTSQILDEFSNEVHARLALNQIESELKGVEIVEHSEYKVNQSEQDGSFTVQDLIAEEIQLKHLKKTNQRELRKTVDYIKRASSRLDQIYLKKLANIPLIESEHRTLSDTILKTFGLQINNFPKRNDPIPVFDADSTKRQDPRDRELDRKVDELISKSPKRFKLAPQPKEFGESDLSLLWSHTVDAARETAKKRALRLRSVHQKYLAVSNQDAKNAEKKARESAENAYFKAKGQFQKKKKQLLTTEDLVEYKHSKKASYLDLYLKPDSGKIIGVDGEQICFVSDDEGIRVSLEWTRGKPEETLFGMKWPLCFRFEDIEAVFVKYGDKAFNDVNQASAYVKELIKSGNIDCGPQIRFVLGVRSGFFGNRSYKVFNSNGQQIKSLTGYYK
jgi:hypothetical protein